MRAATCYLRLKASDVLVLPTHGIPSRHSDLCFAVATTVHVHPKHILLGFVIVDHLGSFYHTVGSEIARAGSGQEGASKGPLDEVRRGVAIDVGKLATAALVLADDVVCAIFLEETRPMRLEVFAVGLDS